MAVGLQCTAFDQVFSANLDTWEICILVSKLFGVRYSRADLSYTFLEEFKTYQVSTQRVGSLLQLSLRGLHGFQSPIVNAQDVLLGKSCISLVICSVGASTLILKN